MQIDIPGFQIIRALRLANPAKQTYNNFGINYMTC